MSLLRFVANQVAARQVLSFRWRGLIWVPMFQFNAVELSLRSGTRQVMRELAGVFDDWATAEWFVQPNAWLLDRPPLDVLDTDLPAVLQAARADRYIVCG